ncbi:hypothetical protein ABT294_00900 [Nonomuraea sp. NPDC000554]|uniref:hypothetical protein n=1 Tax=Nonomuraea sp. NPDC000554 TaxID=3154259 RepID=UPI003322211C
MTSPMNNGASEQKLIQHVLAVIEERLAAAKILSEASFHDPTFMQLRFNEVIGDLELAHDTIAELTDLLYGSEENPVPTELRHAMRSRGGKAQPVCLQLGGIQRTVLVPPHGEDDPIAEARLWRRLQERYGEGRR